MTSGMRWVFVFLWMSAILVRSSMPSLLVAFAHSGAFACSNLAYIGLYGGSTALLCWALPPYVGRRVRTWLFATLSAGLDGCAEVASRSHARGPLDRRMVWTALTAWLLWQETLLPHTPGQPTWQLDGAFAGESACGEARKVRILDQILRAGQEGTTIINQPTVQEGTVWLEHPNGDRTRIRFFCFPETIDPRDPWSSLPARWSRVEMQHNRSWPAPTRTSLV